MHEDNEEWHANSWVNNHIVADLDKLTLQQPYQGNDTVAVGNGSGLHIAHTGSSTFHYNNSLCYLKNILHCPKTSINFLFIKKLCRDNKCYFKLTNTKFATTNNLIGKIIL